MKKLALAGMVVMLLAGVAFAKDYEVNKKAGDFNVVVKIDKNPTVVGDNKVDIEIKDSDGKAVTDAKVKIDYVMPAMPGMPAMVYKTDAELKGTTYKAVMNLSMSGSWNISVKITKGGKTSSMKFTVDAK